MTTESNTNNTTAATGHESASQPARPDRRNFLKGTSLALPAAMTLTPGTALALASITCGQKALDSNLTAPALIDQGADDGFMRFDVTVFDQKVLVPDGNGGMILQPNGIPTYFQDTVAGLWRNVSGASVGASAPSDIGPNSVTKRAIVHIDATDGAAVAHGAASAPANAIITSAAGACMTSLVQRAINNP